MEEGANAVNNEANIDNIQTTINNENINYDISNNVVNGTNEIRRVLLSQLLRPYLRNYDTPRNNWRTNNMDQALQQSFYETKVYKNVMSEEGEKQLKKVEYNKEEYSDSEYCCISYEDFEEGEMITKLPCNHIFKTESINRWLKEESNKCPVCRYELDSMEVRNEIEEEDDNENNNTNGNDNTNDDDDEDEDEEMPDLVDDTDEEQDEQDQRELENMIALRDFLNAARSANNLDFTSMPIPRLRRRNALLRPRPRIRTRRTGVNWDQNTRINDTRINNTINNISNTVNDIFGSFERRDFDADMQRAIMMSMGDLNINETTNESTTNESTANESTVASAPVSAEIRNREYDYMEEVD